MTSYAYDGSGKVRDGKVQELDTKQTDDAYEKARAANQSIANRQQLRVAGSAKYLVVYVRDPHSQRTGSLLLRAELLASLPPVDAFDTGPRQKSEPASP